MMTASGEDAQGAFADERQLEIARYVEERGRARVTELAQRLGVSTVTVRKDLDVLADRGRVIRTHGGAIAPRVRRQDLTYEVRDQLQREEKSAIGAIAASQVGDGESIIIDASTTGLYLARELMHRGAGQSLTIVTNSIRIASELAIRPDISVLLMGGRVRGRSLSLVGQLGDAVLERVNVQKAFLGAGGLTIEEGLTETTEEEAQIKRAMVAAVREVYAIVDSSKWGRVASATFCRPEALTGVITDAGAPDEMVRELEGKGIRVMQHA
ncbi:MAG: DeoR/GlpR family DNA-binding transcription regulator [Chloroflexota bacterium]|jgi:DeoR/GlpR family transcriptional regulator of sugar metabolism